ncbi:MAG: DUF3126 family protein, partial [Hyphomicrobium sp.]
MSRRMLRWRVCRQRWSDRRAPLSLLWIWSRRGSTTSAAYEICFKRSYGARRAQENLRMDKEELARLQTYLRKTFGTPKLEVRARPKKMD